MKKLNLFIVILFVNCFFIFCNKSNAYIPPIGIPDPGAEIYGWGNIHPIDSSAPDIAIKCPNWPQSESVNCYYIDNTHPQATNTNNVYGYPDKPRITIPGTGTTASSSYNYIAGSYVEVHGGPYLENNIWLKLFGEVNNPVWFRGTPSSMPIISKTINILTASRYFFIEYIDFNGGTSGSGVGMSLSSDHGVIRNNKYRNKTWTGNSAGFGVEASENQNINNIIFYNNTINDVDYNLEEWETVDRDFHGFGIGCWSGDLTSEVEQIWILNNYCERVGGNCVQVNSGNWPFSYRYTHHIYVGKNIATNLRQAGFWSKMASDIIFSENKVYNNDAWGSQNGDGYGYQYNPHNLWIIFNEAYDVNFGIRQSDSMSLVYEGWNLSGSAYGKWYIFNEVIHNGVLYYCKTTHVPTVDTEPGVSMNWESYWVASDGTIEDAYNQRKVYIIGNNFHDVYPRREGGAGTYVANDMFRSGVGIALWRGNEQRWVINNTISNAHDGILANNLGNLTINGNIISGRYPTGYQIDIGQAYEATNMDYNNFYDAANGVRLRWNGAIFDSSNDFSINKGQCVHCIDTDPKFISSENYNLQSDSGAKDTNTENNTYSLFQSLFGIFINKDILGTSRPYGSGWDIGAYEYVSDVVSPNAPINLSVQ